jgi:glycosyltransferase involved in cell wall biosynthesis
MQFPKSFGSANLGMKILYISNHFSLPDQPGAPRPWKVAEYLASSGHDVTVLTNRRHYLKESIKVGGDDSKTAQVVRDIKIIGVRTSSGRRNNILKRLLNYLSFSIGSLVAGLAHEGQDVVMTGTPPLIVPVVGIIVGMKHRAFTVLEVRDLYPETAVALGKVKNQLIISLWEKWENFWRRRFDHIVGVVPYIGQALVKKGFDEQKVTVITNGYDMDNETGCELPGYLKEFFHTHKNDFVVLYAGGMGYANNLMTILQAANLCRDDGSIVFAFFGEGELKSRYIQYAREKNLTNCYFFGLQSRKIINEVFRRSGALVQSFLNTEFHKCVFSNKIFEYHGAARPIIYAGRGDSAELIRRAGSGLVVEPENPKEFADAVRYLASHPLESEQMGRSGYEYILQHYTRQEVFKAWNGVLYCAESA